MSPFRKALRVSTAAALLSGFAALSAATATADPNIGDPADINTLNTVLSTGYDPGDCAPQPLANGELAVLACGQNSDPSGPVQATYILFDNASNLSAAFKARIQSDVPIPCGDSGQTPTIWRIGSSGVTAGQVACGTRQNTADVTWTTDSKQIMSDIRGSSTDVNALYQWWRTNG